MKLIIAVLFIAVCYKVEGQNFQLHFYSKATKLPFVSVYDSAHHHNYMADSSGFLKLRNDNYELKISYVGYQEQFIRLNYINHDSIIHIQLFQNTNTLTTVNINSKVAKLRKRIFEHGHFHQKSLGNVTIMTPLKLGVFIRNPDSTQLHLLEGIKFKLNNAIHFSGVSESIEIKLYSVEDNELSEIPLNQKGIFIPINELKKKNQIHLNEKIIIPKEGLFISFEIPDVFSDEQKQPIVFLCNSIADECETFTCNINYSWEVNTLSKSCRNFGYLSDKYNRLNFSILYQNYK